MLKKTLSKSRFVEGSQCSLALWYSCYRSELRPEVSEELQSSFDNKKELKDLAQTYFDQGIDINVASFDIENGILRTKECVDSGESVIFEAIAKHNVSGHYSKVDIFRKNQSGLYDLIAIKSSVSVKEEHYNDIAFQYYIFKNSGFPVGQCFLMIVNNTYTCHGDIDPKKLFKLENVTEIVIKMQVEIASRVDELAKVIEQPNEPKKAIGQHCLIPHNCAFKYHCWRSIPEYSVFDIYQKKKTGEIFAQIRSYDPKDIPPELFPSGSKGIDLASHQNNKVHFERENVKKWLEDLVFPLYFLDYETVSSPIPFFDNTNPYQQVPFQFSLHRLDSPNSPLIHSNFLHQEKSDPREDFVKELIQQCGKSGSIIVYHQTFEESQNKKLAETYPEFSGALYAINVRMKDLEIPFKKRWIYNPKQQGSSSIKYVLPAFTTLSYQNMEIANGEAASKAYSQMLKGNLEDPGLLFKNLLAYCALDTFAMVKLYQVLKEMVATEG